MRTGLFEPKTDQLMGCSHSPRRKVLDHAGQILEITCGPHHHETRCKQGCAEVIHSYILACPCSVSGAHIVRCDEIIEVGGLPYEHQHEVAKPDAEAVHAH